MHAARPRFRLSLVARLLPLLAATAALPAAAGESYVGLGLPGLQIGYAHALNESFGLRADFGTTGSYKRDGAESGIDYKGKITYGRVGLFGDWFPFAGTFRLTGGLTFNDTKLDLRSNFDGVTPVTVNNVTVTPAATDYFNAKVKFPGTTPYLGLGWGHQQRASGLGFFGDLGVSIGRAKLETDTNLVGRYGITQADVDAETQELKDNVGKVRVMPQLSFGVSYRY